MNATVYGLIADYPQPLGKVRYDGERLHYQPADRIPRPVLEAVKRGIVGGHTRARFSVAGITYRYQCDGEPTPTAAPKRNALTGRPVWPITVKTNSGVREMEFEADTRQDALDAAKHLKLAVIG